MCGGVQYRHEGDVKKIYFPNPYAQLPELNKAGELVLVQVNLFRRSGFSREGLAQAGYIRG